jgi:autotransporter-associated beta strand protein
LPTGTQDGSSGITSSNSNDATGILGPWAIVSGLNTAFNNGPDGYTYASANGNIVPYTSATPLTGTGTWGGLPAGDTHTINYDVSVTGTGSAAGNTRSVNTIRYTGPGFAQGGVTLTINGLLNAGTGLLNLSQTLAIGANNELVVDAASAPIILSGVIGNNLANTSRLVVMGPNTTTLSGVNTYTGSTNVNGGTLLVSGAGSIETSSGININGGGAKLVYTSSVASTRNVSVTQGTLDGVGSMGAVTVGNNTGGIVANGNGAVGTLTLSSLTFQGAGSANPVFGGSAGIVVTGALTTNGASGQVALNPSGLLTTGVNDLIHFGSFSGSVNDFIVGANAAVSPRATK